MKCWRDFMASWMLARHWCKWSFNMASWMLARLQYKWSVVVASWKRWMLARLRCNWSFDVARCKYWCNFNASASANVECCRGFMEVLNVGIASVRIEVLSWLHGKDEYWHDFSANMKCWRGLVAKTSIGMTSILMWSVVMTSWQKWIVDIASWLRYKWSDERWHGFDANEVLPLFHGKNKCWHGFSIRTNAGRASW